MKSFFRKAQYDAADLTPYRDADGKLAAYTSLGGYPLVYFCHDGGTLCAKCATKHGQTTDPYDPQWFIVAVDVHWEGPSIICDHCYTEIESAYGDPDATEE